MTVLYVLGATSGLLAAMLVTLLALPISVCARGLVEGDRLWGELSATWAWGATRATWAPGRREITLLGRPLSSSALSKAASRWIRHRKSKATGGEAGGKPKSRTGPHRSKSQPWSIRLAQLGHLLGTVRILVVRLVSALHLRLTVEGRAGLDDPADTAVAYTLVRNAARGLPARVEFLLEPDYVESRLDVRSRLSATVWPGELLLCLLLLLLRADVRRALWALRS